MPEWRSEEWMLVEMNGGRAEPGPMVRQRLGQSAEAMFRVHFSRAPLLGALALRALWLERVTVRELETAGADIAGLFELLGIRHTKDKARLLDRLEHGNLYPGDISLLAGVLYQAELPSALSGVTSLDEALLLHRWPEFSRTSAHLLFRRKRGANPEQAMDDAWNTMKAGRRFHGELLSNPWVRSEELFECLRAIGSARDVERARNCCARRTREGWCLPAPAYQVPEALRPEPFRTAESLAEVLEPLDGERRKPWSAELISRACTSQGAVFRGQVENMPALLIYRKTRRVQSSTGDIPDELVFPFEWQSVTPEALERFLQEDGGIIDGRLDTPHPGELVMEKKCAV